MSASSPFLMRAAIMPLQKEQKACTRLDLNAYMMKVHAKARRRLDIRAQSFRDEGRNVVDSNMKLLKERIEVMKAKERLERDHRPSGWDYASTYIQKRPEKHANYLQTIALICSTSSLSILIGTILLCMFSVIVHLNM